MPRKPREEVAGGAYHVYARGNRKEPIFVDDEDRERYLSRFGMIAREFGWRPLAFCLMTNHVHHVIELTRPNLGVGLREIHREYAKEFNQRHATGGGHLFEKRYGCTPSRNAGTLMYFACYVVLNPVRAGMCDRPEEFAWSSYAPAAGLGSGRRWLDSARLLEHFGSVERFVTLVDAVRIMGAAGFEPALTRV